MISVAGVPIYLHYCCGELEKINYVLKSDTCCDGEEDHEDAAADDCCKDENIVLKNSTDFTIKKLSNFDHVKSYHELFYVSLPFLSDGLYDIKPLVSNFSEFPPARLQNSLVISTSVLRI